MKTAGFKQSRKSVEDYIRWRIKRARFAVDRVSNLQKLKDANVLDIGCGYGPLCSVLLDMGAKVTGIEIDEKKLNTASNYLKKTSKLKLLKVKNEKLPFKKNTFDAVFLFDVIEHIKNPSLTISECGRVLKPSGVLYVEFTPYYSITGHHLYDFAKWPIHFLPKKYIKQIVYSKNIEGFLTADDYWRQFESLNKLKISQFQKLVKDFRMVDERFIIKYPELFEINMPFLKLFGYFKDFFTMSFEGIYLNGERK